MKKIRVHYREEAKQLSKQRLAAKKSAQDAVLKSVLSKEYKCWAELHRYLNSAKEKGKIFLPLKNYNGRITTVSIKEFKSINFLYSTVYSSDGNIQHIQEEKTCEPLTIVIK